MGWCHNDTDSVCTNSITISRGHTERGTVERHPAEQRRVIAHADSISGGVSAASASITGADQGARRFRSRLVNSCDRGSHRCATITDSTIVRNHGRMSPDHATAVTVGGLDRDHEGISAAGVRVSSDIVVEDGLELVVVGRNE